MFGDSSLNQLLRCDYSKDVRCPTCHTDETRVADSRMAENGSSIRRRRHCSGCGYRFTTFERVEEVPLTVVKSCGKHEPFDRTKVENGISAAAKGRGIDDDTIAVMASDVEDAVRASGSVIPATQIGVAVLEQLRVVDEVAYLRFASVYKEFDGAADFHREIELLTKQPQSAGPIS